MKPAGDRALHAQETKEFLSVVAHDLKNPLSALFGYADVLLDTVAVAEWFRRRHGAPPFAFADRARAATLWLHRVASPGGALPRCGPA